jgi:hypothetical protein
VDTLKGVQTQTAEGLVVAEIMAGGVGVVLNKCDVEGWVVDFDGLYGEKWMNQLFLDR